MRAQSAASGLPAFAASSTDRAAATTRARSVELAAKAGKPEAALWARINWARALQFQGDYSETLDRLVGEALVLARESGERRVETSSLTQLGILAFQRGQYGVARGHYEQALAVTRAVGDRSSESGLINNLGEIERLLGNYEAAFDLFQAGRRLCGEIGQRLADAYMLCNVAHVAFLRGDAAESIRWATEALKLGEELKDRDLQAILRCVRAHAHVALGEWDDAAACYRASLALFREIGRPTMVPEPIAGLARIALARGDVDGAMETIAEVVAHFDAGGSVDGSEDPMWIYLTCHQVLAAARSARAAEFLDRAHTLLVERARPLDDAERASFLVNVPSHRAIVAAWAASERAVS